MFALRCTQKLLTRLKAKPVAEVPPATTRLGDWYANLVMLRCRHLVVALSERTLLPVIIEAAPGSTLPDRLRAGVGHVLRHLGIDDEAIAGELAAMHDVAIAMTASKSILGSLNDFVHMFGFHLDDGEANLLNISLKLAETPCSPFAYESPKARTVALFREVGSTRGLGCSPTRPRAP